MKKRTDEKRTTPADVEAIRAEIATKREARQELADAPPSHADLAAHLDRTLALSVERSERRVASLIAGRDYGAESLLTARVHTTSDGIDRVDLLPTVIALFGVDPVRKSLSRFIDRAEDGPSPTVRAERLAAIDAELLALEQAEERAIRSLETEGVDIVRRADASPAVVLADL